jgi:branched-chain amino acid transport system permease protein
MHLLEIPIQAWAGQIFVGLINGSFYAMLSLGLAIIFGLLNIVNFAHGALYMVGAFAAWMLLNYAGVGYWPALILAPLIVGLLGAIIEKLFLSRLYKVDALYSMLITYGMTLMLEGVFRNLYGSSGLPYGTPEGLGGGINLGFMYMPSYRLWVIVLSMVVCFATWLVIERTRLGSYLRAAIENADLVQAFGINVPRLLTLTYASGVALAALAGVVAAPIYSVSPSMGTDMLIVVFAVVVIGGMGSIMGAVVTGFGLGLIEGITKVVYPQASTLVIFFIMIIVLVVKPNGLFGDKA